MDDIELPTADKANQSRVSQACQRCRSLKTRCLPSERAGTCQRCSHSKRECVWAETPRRPRRIRGPSRISQVEQKIDGLVASLVNSEPSRRVVASAPENERILEPDGAPKETLSSQDRPLAPGSWLPFPSSFENRRAEPAPNGETPQLDAEPTHQFLEKLREIHTFGEDIDLNRASNGIFHGIQKCEPAIENEKVQKLLITGEAETLLTEYRSMCASFPFVPLAATISASYLHAIKPMLFLAVMTVASWKDHQRQLSLDELYRTELANRTFIRPRRTLSLLQSILVYLSRYHFVFSHKTQQIYFMQQLALGLALDLGLHQRYRRFAIDIPGRQPPQPPSLEDTLERQRTFLGCYYLSSVIAAGLQKPNLLKYSDYMAECIRNLDQAHQYQSDAILGHLVALRRLDDQIHDLFFTEDTVDLPLSNPQILMNFRFIETQLDQWKKVEWDDEFHRVLELSSSFTDIQLHGIALRPTATSNPSVSPDPVQFNALLATLEACKRYFDTILEFPVSEYHLISFPEWMHLPYVVISLARLCIPSDTHSASQWDVKSAHERARLDLYLESLCYRMQGLSTYNKATQPHPDFYAAMKMIMDLSRKWFVRKLQGKKTTSVQNTPNGLPTPDTAQSAGIEALGTDPSVLSSMNEACFPRTMSASMGGEGSTSQQFDDPFTFMTGVDFDMDKFFDMGLWGDESYVGMGFGGGF